MRRSAPLLLALQLLLLAPPAAQAATVEELAARVDRAITLAEAGVRAPSPEAMEAVRSALALPDVVQLSPAPVEVPADPYLAALEGSTADEFERALRHLRALEVRLAERASPGAVPDLEAHLDAAYRGAAPPEPSWWERALELLDSFLSAIFRNVGEAVAGAPSLWLLVLLSLGAAAFIWRFRVRLSPEAAVRPVGGRAAQEEWRRRAEAARARGDLAEAVAAMYRALVSELAQRGLVEDRVSLTAGELRRATRDTALERAIELASRAYERVRYGRAGATEADLEALARAERTARSR